MSFMLDDDDDFAPAKSPLDDQTALLERISQQLCVLQETGVPMTEVDVGAIRGALDAIAHKTPDIVAALGSIKVAVWIVAFASVVHLLR